MRGEYASIHTAIVDDPEFQKLSSNARGCWFVLRLLLGASGIDLIRAHRVALAQPTGLDEGAVEPALQELENGSWLVREGDVLWLRNALRFNPSMNTKNKKHRTGIEKHLAGLPRLPIVCKFAAYYDLDAPFLVPSDSHSDSLSNGYAKQDIGHRTSDVGQPTSDNTELRSRSVSPNAGREWNGAAVIDLWIRFGRAHDWPDPPRAEIAKQGAAGKRIAEKHDSQAVVAAMIGMDTIFPHSPPKGQPWDLFTLERKFVEAYAAAKNHPKLREAAVKRQFLEAS